MATPMTADQFVAALRAEGLTVSEMSGWRTNNRDHIKAFGPVNGVVIHHTAGTDSKSLVFNGTADLPGPLCNSYLPKTGTVYMVGNGRANHAGEFATNAFNAMVAESATHPVPGPDAIDANSRTYGIEIENLGNGSDFYPQAQYDAAVKWAAAICRFHGWTANSVIGHKEGTSRKIDPKGPIGSKSGPAFDMNAFRADVAARLKGIPAPAKTYAPFPGTAWFKKNPKSAIVTAMGKRLVAEGCSAYTSGPGPQWTDADKRSYAKWQRKRGFSGADADGWPGKTTWDALKVPKV
ncbi:MULTISPECIES: peptidoglycan-binding protein [unclassified Streptomyces]|uniref:peptidoglycan-binding protein n=1 Tax=Streptomyces sp. NPDC056835 TaxID=3345956 RepID=UPI0036CB7D15